MTWRHPKSSNASGTTCHHDPFSNIATLSSHNNHITIYSHLPFSIIVNTTPLTTTISPWLSLQSPSLQQPYHHNSHCWHIYSHNPCSITVTTVTIPLDIMSAPSSHNKFITMTLTVATTTVNITPAILSALPLSPHLLSPKHKYSFRHLNYSPLTDHKHYHYVFHQHLTGTFYLF